MYERASAKKVFIFGVGAILFGVAVVPLSMQLFIYATNFAVPPNGEIDGNPLLPMQFVILAPLAGIVWLCFWRNLGPDTNALYEKGESEAIQSICSTSMVGCPSFIAADCLCISFSRMGLGE